MNPHLLRLWQPENRQHRFNQQALIWSLFGVYLSLSALGEQRYGDQPAWVVWYGEMTGAYAAGVLSPWMRWFALRVNQRFSHGLQQMAIHIGFTPVAALLAMLVMDALRYPVYVNTQAFDPYPWFWWVFERRFFIEWPRVGMVYCIVVAIYLVRYRYDLQEKALLHTKTLEAKLSNQRLLLLKHQLQPHFLFNTLNMISEFIYSNADKADFLLNQLSALLRHYLSTSEQTVIALTEELRLLTIYLDIMKERFPGLIHFTQTIDPDCEPCLIPPMLLQPLVENSIKHSQASLGHACDLKLSATSTPSGFELCLADNNPVKLQDNPAKGLGLGLANLKEQLYYVYHGQARLQFESSLTGSQVLIFIPRENKA